MELERTSLNGPQIWSKERLRPAPLGIVRRSA